MRVYEIRFMVPDDYSEPGQTVEDDLNALKNKDLPLEDLQFLAEDRESDVTVEYRVYDQ